MSQVKQSSATRPEVRGFFDKRTYSVHATLATLTLFVADGVEPKSDISRAEHRCSTLRT